MRQNVINLSSAELAQRVVKVQLDPELDQAVYVLSLNNLNFVGLSITNCLYQEIIIIIIIIIILHNLDVHKWLGFTISFGRLLILTYLILTSLLQMHFAVHWVKALYSLDQITWTLDCRSKWLSFRPMGCIPWISSSWTRYMSA